MNRFYIGNTVLPNPVTISIQSDITFYQFTLDAIETHYSLPDPIICPTAESRFWFSIYDDSTSTTTQFGAVTMGDESPSGIDGWGWQFFCLEPGSLASSAYAKFNNCTDPYARYKAIGPTNTKPDRVFIGGPYRDNNLIAFIWPSCYRRVMLAFPTAEDGDDVYFVQTMQGIILFIDAQYFMYFDKQITGLHSLRCDI